MNLDPQGSPTFLELEYSIESLIEKELTIFLDRFSFMGILCGNPRCHFPGWQIISIYLWENMERPHYLFS